MIKLLTINLKKNIHIFVKSIKKVLSSEFFQQSCIINRNITNNTISISFLKSTMPKELVTYMMYMYQQGNLNFFHIKKKCFSLV